MEYGILKNTRMFNSDRISLYTKYTKDENTHQLSTTGQLFILNPENNFEEDTIWVKKAKGRVSLDLRISFTVPLSLYSKEPVFGSDTLTLRRLLTTNGAQRWELEAGLSPINQVEILALFTGSGYNKVMYVKTPQLPEIGDINRPNVLINQVTENAKAGSNLIKIASTASKTLKRGEFIRFANHWKTYLVIENSGNLLKIYPSLIMPVTYRSAIFCNDAVITLFLADAGSNIGISFDNGLVSNMTCKFVEFINPRYFVDNPFAIASAGPGNVATDMAYSEDDKLLTVYKGRKAVRENEAISKETIASILNRG